MQEYLNFDFNYSLTPFYNIKTGANTLLRQIRKVEQPLLFVSAFFMVLNCTNYILNVIFLVYSVG